MKKRNIKRLLFATCMLLIPIVTVNAGGSRACSSLNSGDVQINWNHGFDGNYTSLQGGGIYWCLTDNKADYTAAAMGGQIYELMYENTKSGLGKFRAFCMDQGRNAPAEIGLVFKKAIWDKGPACAFYKFSSLVDDEASSKEIRHNRIRYIQRNSDATFACKDPYIYSTCLGGDRLDEIKDIGKISISTLTEYADDTGSNYYIYKADGIKMTGNDNGKPTKYTPKLEQSVPGAIIGTSASATSSVTSTSSTTLYIKIPKNAVTTTSKFTLKLEATYSLGCHYTQFGLAEYHASKNVSDWQRVAFRITRAINVKDNGTATTSKSFTITPDDPNTNIIVEKTSSSGSLILEGAEFGLYTNSNCTIPVSDTTVDQTATLGSGIAVFNVKKNTGYYIKETKAPTGYNLSYDCKYVNSGEKGATISFVNYPVTVIPTGGTITVEKKDEDTNELINDRALFQLFSDNSCTTSATGESTSALYTSGGVAKFNVSSDTKTYYIKEILPPSGYSLPEESCKPAVAGETIEFLDKKLEVETEYKEVSIKKVDKNTKAVLPGAKFGLYSDSTCSTVAYDKNDNLMVETGIDGIAKFTVNSANTYYIREITPPDGYKLDENACRPAVIDGVVEFENEKLPTYVPINIEKVDADNSGIKLAQAKFGLFSDNTCSTSVKDYHGNSEALTNGYGSASFVVEEGKTYYIKELLAPTGYEMDSTCIQANTANYITVKNTKIPDNKKGSISIDKTEVGTKKGIGNVTFRLYAEDKTTPAMDADGNTIDLIETDENGKAIISNLYYGKYYLKEIDAPKIYYKETNLIEVNLDKETEEIAIENAPRTILFIKRDSAETEYVLNGGKYKVVNEQDELVKEFTITNNEPFELVIEPGNYKFIETEAPEGYVDSNLSFNFKVEESGDVMITSEESKYYYVYDGIGINILNDKEEIIPDVPKTGNMTNKVIAIVAIILIGAGTTSIIIIKKRKASK